MSGHKNRNPRGEQVVNRVETLLTGECQVDEMKPLRPGTAKGNECVEGKTNYCCGYCRGTNRVTSERNGKLDRFTSVWSRIEKN